MKEMSKASSRIITLGFMKAGFGLLGNLFGRIQVIEGLRTAG